jgi:hypothetical protein
MNLPDADDSVAINRRVWTNANTRYADARASSAWQEPEITRGIWHVPETQLRTPPPELAGLDAVELGVGTACLFIALLSRKFIRMLD